MSSDTNNGTHTLSQSDARTDTQHTLRYTQPDKDINTTDHILWLRHTVYLRKYYDTHILSLSLYDTHTHTFILKPTQCGTATQDSM